MPTLDEPVHLYAIGTAGSGKTRFTAGFQRYLKQGGHDAITVNLDPGAERLPYGPDVDIRDWVVLSDVMDQYELGPNGAQVVAADLIALRAPEVKEAIEEFRPDYVLFDTPGQTELFVFREAGKITVDLFGRERAIFAFLMDPYLSKSPSAYVSQLLLAATTNFRFGLPQMNVLTKADLIKEDDLATLVRWSKDPDELMTALYAERADMYTQMATDVARVLEGLGGPTHLFPVSSETLEGFEDVTARAEDILLAAEDMETGAGGD